MAMEHGGSWNLLDQAIGPLIEDRSAGRSGGSVVLIEDCVETSGAFVLHHLIKRSLSPLPPHSSPVLLILVSFAHSFSHYDRILRKMGCNVVVQRDNKRFIFLDMRKLECPEAMSDGDGGDAFEGGLVALYGKIQKAVEVSIVNGGSRSIVIMIDDISLLEVAAKGSSNHVLDFLHYCHTLKTEFGCSLAVLNHEDIYSSTERSNLILQMEYLSEVIIKAEPLATGLAKDVHGQLTVMNKRNFDGLQNLQKKMSNFHFRLERSNLSKKIPMFEFLVKEAISYLEFGLANPQGDQNTGDLVLRSCNTYVMGTAMEFLYFSGTSYREHPWVNPVLSKRITISASSPISRYTDPKVLVSRTYQGTSYAGPRIEDGRNNVWWMIDIGQDHQLVCNYYTLRPDGSRAYVRCWKFQGSLDGKTSTDLRVHENDLTMCKPGQFASWPVVGPSALLPFRFFRVVLTDNPWNFCICFLELYSYFR